MRYWTICYPGELGQYIQETFSEDQIIEMYYTYWSDKMRKVNNEAMISRENCIADWCIVHWAVETDEFGKTMWSKTMKPCNTEIKLVTCPEGDWEKVYVNGKFLDAGHSIDWQELIKFLGYNLVVTEISNEEKEMESNPYG